MVKKTNHQKVVRLNARGIRFLNRLSNERAVKSKNEFCENDSIGDTLDVVADFFFCNEDDAERLLNFKILKRE